MYSCDGEPDLVFQDRMKSLRASLIIRPEKTIILVCHWGVIRALTGVSVANCGVRICRMSSLLEVPYLDDN